MRAFYEFPAVYRKQQTAFCLYRKGMESKMIQEEKYMREAIRQARKAEALREVPIGCIIVFDGKIIGRVITAGQSIKMYWPMQN